MSNMTPFEIRLELLKMASGMLSDEYFGKREQISNQWAVDCETAKVKGEEPPKHPGFPPYPSESEIIAKAKTLNDFVSNITVETKTTNKKSTT
jgi:hypothetical protein